MYEGFGSRHVALATGLLVVLAGLISCAMITRGFVGYLQVFVELPWWLGVSGVVLGLGLLAAWGIAESVSLAALLTLIEAAGLVFVIWSGRAGLVFALGLPLETLARTTSLLTLVIFARSAEPVIRQA